MKVYLVQGIISELYEAPTEWNVGVSFSKELAEAKAEFLMSEGRVAAFKVQCFREESGHILQDDDPRILALKQELDDPYIDLSCASYNPINLRYGVTEIDLLNFSERTIVDAIHKAGWTTQKLKDRNWRPARADVESLRNRIADLLENFGVKV